MTCVVTWLVNLGRVRADESIAHLRLVASLDKVGPNTDALLVIIGKARRTFVLGCLSVPA